jgi:peptidoglycan hydrolase CwlO-like protein
MGDPTLAQAHPAEVWKALLTAVGIIGTLVGVLYYRLNQDILSQERKLDDGNKAFIDIGNRLIALGEKVANLQTDGVYTNQEMDRLYEEIKELTRIVTVLKVEHDNCIPRKISMKGSVDDNRGT